MITIGFFSVIARSAFRDAAIPDCRERQEKGRDVTDRKPVAPLHGATLELMLARLLEGYGREEMGRTIAIRCFNNDPSTESSLQFLRKNPWARDKVEDPYLRYARATLKKNNKKPGRQDG
jgi:uncharacterized protein (DUF2132 family)